MEVRIFSKTVLGSRVANSGGKAATGAEAEGVVGELAATTGESPGLFVAPSGAAEVEFAGKGWGGVAAEPCWIVCGTAAAGCGWEGLECHHKNRAALSATNSGGSHCFMRAFQSGRREREHPLPWGSDKPKI